MSNKLIDLTGKRFGRLVVIKRIENRHSHTVWLCKCDCGNFTKRISCGLRSGSTKSCGCLQKENIQTVGHNNKKHGLTHTRLFSIWCSMQQRCYDKKCIQYKNYGARGIKVCDEWLNDFVTFYTWSIKNGYNRTLTIDRINVNGNYEPDNCRWVTMVEQGNNKRNNHYLEYNGKRLTISQWSKELDINVTTIYERLKRGWDINRTLTTPVKQTKRRDVI